MFATFEGVDVALCVAVWAVVVLIEILGIIPFTIFTEGNPVIVLTPIGACSETFTCLCGEMVDVTRLLTLLIFVAKLLVGVVVPEIVTFVVIVSFEVVFERPSASGDSGKPSDKGKEGDGRKSTAGDAGGDAMIYDAFSYAKSNLEGITGAGGDGGETEGLEMLVGWIGAGDGLR